VYWIHYAPNSDKWQRGQMRLFYLLQSYFSFSLPKLV